MNLGLQNLETSMFYLMFVSYLLSMFCYWIWASFKNEFMGKFATALAIIGFGATTAAIVIRMLIVQRPPLSNGYEFLLTFCWGILAVYLFAEFKYRLKALGVFVLPVAFLLLAYIAMKMGPEERVAQAIPPALKSQWLTFHVFTAILAYGAFTVAFGLGLMYLLKNKLSSAQGNKANKTNKANKEEEEGTGLISRFPPLDTLDELAYRVVGFAFPLLSLCIITGAIWANYAWGTYWSWDPKETWSLVTWLIYAGYLHARLMYGWKGKRAAWMAVFGFVAVLFTFFGVNYFLPGLHSYA